MTTGLHRPAAISAADVRRVLSKLDDLLLVAVLAGGSWWGYQQLVPDRDLPPQAPPPAIVIADDTPELRLLHTLEVKGRAPKTGYARHVFGPRWADVDRNGCDTRNDILRRDLTDVRLDPSTRGCVVLAGDLVDPYTAQSIAFVKGNKTSPAVQIDHVVSLSDAWQKGAQQWTEDKRTRFANDPANLLATGQRSNQQKGDGDAATWLPSHKRFRCDYVAKQVTVKAAYGVWITTAERDAIARILGSCR